MVAEPVEVSEAIQQTSCQPPRQAHFDCFESLSNQSSMSTVTSPMEGNILVKQPFKKSPIGKTLPPKAHGTYQAR